MLMPQLSAAAGQSMRVHASYHSAQAYQYHAVDVNLTATCVWFVWCVYVN